MFQIATSDSILIHTEIGHVIQTAPPEASNDRVDKDQEVIDRASVAKDNRSRCNILTRRQSNKKNHKIYLTEDWPIKQDVFASEVNQVRAQSPPIQSAQPETAPASHEAHSAKVPRPKVRGT